MISADFRALLLAQPTVAALVDGRVYPVLIPAEVFDTATRKPCLVYSSSNVDRSSTFCGTIGLQTDTMVVDCYARSYDGAQNLAEAARAIVDFRGTIGSTEFVAVKLTSELDLYDLEPGLFRRTLTFTIWNTGV